MLPIHAATNDHGLGVCIWEGESVDAVRDVVEGVVGPFANNEYHEMQVDGSRRSSENSRLVARAELLLGRETVQPEPSSVDNVDVLSRKRAGEA